MSKPINDFVGAHVKYLTKAEQEELKDLLYLLTRTKGLTRFLELYSIARMGDGVKPHSSDYELGSRDVLFQLRKLLSIID